MKNNSAKNEKTASFAIHQLANTLVYQATEEVIISGKKIPKGYVNVTQLCQANKKKLNNWSRNERSKAYIEALSMETRILAPMLLIEIEGTTQGRDASFQGTFAHPEIAISIAAWISPEFEVWGNRVLRAVINNDFQALTPEAAKAQAELQKVWDDLRIHTKETFWFVTAAIKEYYLQNPRVEKYPGQNYAEYFDCLNLGLFSKKAKQIAEELAVKGGLNRDNFGKQSLKHIEMIQRISESQINQGMPPLEACELALKIMNYKIINYKD